MLDTVDGTIKSMLHYVILIPFSVKFIYVQTISLVSLYLFFYEVGNTINNGLT
jgi:hypothetical protein